MQSNWQTATMESIDRLDETSAKCKASVPDEFEDAVIGVAAQICVNDDYEKAKTHMKLCIAVMKGLYRAGHVHGREEAMKSVGKG